MKLITFTHSDAHAGTPHVGVLDGDHVACLTQAGIASNMHEIIAGGPSMLARIRDGLAAAPRFALAEVSLLAPIQPGKVLCSGVNYRAHVLENPNAKMPSEPFFFAKLPSSITGPNAPVTKPTMTEQLDYEVEFAVVIGRRLHLCDEAEVMPAIFGYTLLNDISARDVQFKDAQITLGKNFAGFAPIGPCIVTADAIDPNAVALKTRLNGRTLQDGNTSDWLFPLPRLLSFLSHVMPLEPGDIVTTGTPAGVGLFRTPPVFMHEGDVVEIEAEGIGILRTPIVAP